MANPLKRKLFTMFSELLVGFGFKREGNYFRRNSGAAMQAIYLYPSRHSGEHFPELCITYPALSSVRKNTQEDAHLRARLSFLYNPKGDPSANPDWSCRLERLETDYERLKQEMAAAIQAALAWFELYPEWEIAADRMRIWKFAKAVFCHELFNDQGVKVPVPVVEDDKVEPKGQDS
jgi:hypothetical protein